MPAGWTAPGYKGPKTEWNVKEALDWVNEQVGGILDACARTGRRTPGGRLMAPPAAAAPAAEPAP